MTEVDEERLTGALQVWLERHPAPDQICLQLAEGVELTPRDLVGQITKRTDVGQLFLRVVDSAKERVPFDEIIDDLTVVHPEEPRPDR